MPMTQKRNLIILSGVVILLAALFYFIGHTSIYNLISNPFKGYLSIHLALAIHVLEHFGLYIQQKGLLVFYKNMDPVTLNTGYLMKKWLLFVLVLVWATPAPVKRKVVASLVYLLLQFVALQLNFIVFLQFYAWDYSAKDAKQIAQSVALLFFFAFVVLWVYKNKALLGKLSVLLKLETTYVTYKYRTLLVLMCILLVISVLLAAFDFGPWIALLFNTTHSILALLGYESTVQPFALIGPKADIFMAKGCLGIMTSYLFAGFVYLTGEKRGVKLGYIFVGILVLNLANIIRFVALFIHLQRHGAYLWGIEVHDMFNVVIYALVFVLWVIWLNRVTDIWPHIKPQKPRK